MPKIEFIVSVDVDEDAAAEHVVEYGDKVYPLVADPSEWTWDDLVGAIKNEIATGADITGFTLVSS